MYMCAQSDSDGGGGEDLDCRGAVEAGAGEKQTTVPTEVRSISQLLLHQHLFQ